MNKMRYKLVIYLRTESSCDIFETKEEAEEEKKYLEFLQPENIYEIEEIDNEMG